MESLVLEIIKGNLIPFEEQFNHNGSAGFNKELAKYREYLHKRMSFGSIFQDAIPFSAALLDSNLNLVWANNLFYENFYLKEKKLNESLNWDYLQQFTNLGENDPVLVALNQGIAGIYQIQIKRHKEEEGLPYEMYVSSVKYAKQSRIMIFFYPLQNLEATIKNQTKSIIGPISRTLDTLKANSFEKETRKKLEKDFEIAGVGEVFKKFEGYNQFVNQQKDGLSEEIKSLENLLYNQYQLMVNVREVRHKFEDTIQKTIKNFGLTKDAVVHNIDLRYNFEGQFKRSLNVLKSILKEEDSLLQKSQKAGQIIEENIKAFDYVSSIRDKFRELRLKIDDFRHRLNQSVDQTLLFVRRDAKQDLRLEEGLGKIRLEMKGIEQIFSSFSEVVKNLDVGLSKIELIVEQSEKPNFDDFQNQMKMANRELEELTFQLGHITRSGEKSDDVIVEGLKSLYEGFQNCRRLGNNIFELIKIDKNTLAENKTQTQWNSRQINDL